MVFIFLPTPVPTRHCFTNTRRVSAPAGIARRLVLRPAPNDSYPDEAVNQKSQGWFPTLPRHLVSQIVLPSNVILNPTNPNKPVPSSCMVVGQGDEPQDSVRMPINAERYSAPRYIRKETWPGYSEGEPIAQKFLGSERAWSVKVFDLDGFSRLYVF